MTLLVIGYESKKALKEHLGKSLRYRETSIFGNEYLSTGTFTVAHRPQITGGKGREFFATVTMKNDIITKVE